MNSSGYPNPFFEMVASGGILGILLVLALWVLGFIISALLTSLWVRLFLFFTRSALDREYRNFHRSR